MIHVVDDLRYREHIGPDGHPERPARLEAVAEALSGFESALRRETPRGAENHEILRVHAPSHLATVAEAARRAPARLDADTYVSAKSFEVAQLAAGATIDAARAVAAGEVRCSLAAVRPPGHHAESTHAMGFCLFNNVAIAARALQECDRVGKILILDWDVHHGNGTQHCFEADPSVLYVSTHQYPYYPGTGDSSEIGTGRGEGATFNVPMPAGCGDSEYLGVLQRLVAPAVRAFEPEIVLLSCGFDAHRDDPLASMTVSREGFRAMTSVIRELADELCAGRIACVLEGGYAATGLWDGTTSLLEGLLADAANPPGVEDLEPGSMLRGIVDRVSAVHGSRIPGLGAG